MMWLGLDTATPACSIALWTPAGLISDTEWLASPQHSEQLLRRIEAVRIRAQLPNWSQLSGIVVGVGPGSFMGVRLAVCVAQAMAFATKIPVFPVSSLQIVAETAAAKWNLKKAHIAWDARMNQVYYGVYQRDEGGIMQCIGEEQLCAPGSIAIPVSHSCVGNGWSVYREAWGMSETPPHADIVPDISCLLSKLGPTVSVTEGIAPEQLAPVYLRAAVVH